MIVNIIIGICAVFMFGVGIFAVLFLDRSDGKPADDKKYKEDRKSGSRNKEK